VCNLLHQLPVEKIFLIQSAEPSLLEKFADEEHESKKNAAVILDQVTQKLQKAAGPNTHVKYAISDFPLLRAIHQAINSLDPDLLIAGSDSEGDESPIGDEIITISKSSPVPVLVIPSGCRYEPVKKALLPCNFADLSSLTLLEGLTPLESVQLKLLNVDPDNDFANQRSEIEQSISELLLDYKHDFNYSTNEDIVEGILEFFNNNNIQLVIALPGKRSFFYRLTHTSISQALTQNSAKPVLLLKDDEN